MAESKRLLAGITRNNREMADGRTIRYYDSANQSRTAPDQRPVE
jgi:UDPglucose--hexose-1-phosphate uridylyltransferase